MVNFALLCQSYFRLSTNNLQLSHLNVTEILFVLKTLLFQILAKKESRPIRSPK